MKLRKPDILFSKILRFLRPKCEKCGRETSLQCSHYWGRRAEITRYCEINCDVFCYGCHQRFEENPQEYYEWKLKKLGLKLFNWLKRQHNKYLKRDDNKRVEELKEKYKDIIDKI
jgi:hypothetical protein